MAFLSCWLGIAMGGFITSFRLFFFFSFFFLFKPGPGIWGGVSDVVPDGKEKVFSRLIKLIYYHVISCHVISCHIIYYVHFRLIIKTK